MIGLMLYSEVFKMPLAKWCSSIRSQTELRLQRRQVIWN